MTKGPISLIAALLACMCFPAAQARLVEDGFPEARKKAP